VEETEPDCVYAPGCGLRPVWQAISAAVEQVLTDLSLADIAARVREPLDSPRSSRSTSLTIVAAPK